jgi:hypothetical protein
MVANGGGGVGVFAAVVNEDNVMAAVAIAFLVDGGGGDGHCHL